MRAAESAAVGGGRAAERRSDGERAAERRRVLQRSPPISSGTAAATSSSRALLSTPAQCPRTISSILSAPTASTCLHSNQAEPLPEPNSTAAQRPPSRTQLPVLQNPKSFAGAPSASGCLWICRLRSASFFRVLLLSEFPVRANFPGLLSV